jgi:hypothetical protein
MHQHILQGVRVILAKKSVENAWVDHQWEVHDLLPLEQENGDGTFPVGYVPVRPMREELGLFMADVKIDLHHAEAEAYAENIQSSDPSIYIVLRSVDEDIEEDMGGLDGIKDAEMIVVEVSLSPYTIQDYEDCGEDKIMKVPLTGPIARLVEDFVEKFFKPEEFIKRKRDRARIDEDRNRGGDRRIRR